MASQPALRATRNRFSRGARPLRLAMDQSGIAANSSRNPCYAGRAFLSSAQLAEARSRKLVTAAPSRPSQADCTTW
jgi:hypothetical protein